MKKISILILIFMSFLLSAEKINLKDAIKKGIKISNVSKNLSIQEKIDIINKDISEKKKNFVVNLSGSYLFRSDIMEINFPDTVLSPTMTIPGKSMDAGAYHNFDLNLSILQPIYSGGIISNNIKLKKNNIDIGKNNTKLSSLQLSGKIKNSYFKYLLLKEENNILTVLLEELNQHKQKLKDLFEEDLIGKSGILETELKINEIKLNREELKKQIFNEENEFYFLCETRQDNIAPYTEEIPNFEKALLFYKNNHSILKNIKINKSSLDIKKNISKGFYRPQINSFLEFHYGKPGIDFFKNSWSPYIQTGINIKYKIFDWNKQKKENKVLDYLKQKLENKKTELIRIVSKNLKILYNTKTHLDNKIKITQRMIKNSEEIKIIKEKLFIEKQITNLEYLSLIQKIKKYKIIETKIRLNIELLKTSINTLIGKI